MGYCEPAQEDANASSINASGVVGSGSLDFEMDSGEGEGGAYYVDEVQASYNCARDDTSVTNAYAEYEGVNYAIDLMLVTLCLAVAFSRAGYTEYLKRGKSGAKGDDDDDDDAGSRGDKFHSVKWWLYNTFKSQDFRESIEVCFGAALNIIDLQGVEPENKGIYDWVLVVIFIQLLFVLAGENLILANRIVWRRVASFCNVRTKLGATQFDVDGANQAEEGFEDTEQGKFLEMIFVHLSTLILRCNLPMDPGNAVFILYAAINVIPLVVKLVVEGKRKAQKLLSRLDADGDGIPDQEEEVKLKPLVDAMKGSNDCNYLTPEFHFDCEFDKADIDGSGGLSKSEFTKFLRYVFKKQSGQVKQEDAESLFDQISQSVKQRAENQGDPRVLHERFSMDQDLIDNHCVPNRKLQKNKILRRRKEKIAETDPQHRSLEDMGQLARIVTKQDILIGCVKYFDRSSRDGLYLNQARSLLQFLKRGHLYINDQDDVLKLSEDEKHFRVMAAIDLCNGVLETHDIRLAGQFCGDTTSPALDSLNDLLQRFSNPANPTDAEKFAYRTEGVAIIKANLYKVAALYCDTITPSRLKADYAKTKDDKLRGPWVLNLTRARNAMDQMEQRRWDGDGHTAAIRKWFDKEFKQYTSCKELKDFDKKWEAQGIAGMRAVNQRHFSGSNIRSMRSEV